MRRLVVAILLAAPLALAGCSSTSSPTDAQTTGTPAVGTFETPGISVTLSPETLTNNIDPCTLMKAADLTEVFSNVSSAQPVPGLDSTDPYGVNDERICEYDVIIAGVYGANNPSLNGNYEFTILITTYGKDSSNDVWTILSQGQPPVTGIGDGAFYGDGQGDLTAHKGSTIIHIWSQDDPSRYLGNAAVTELARLALSRAPR